MTNLLITDLLIMALAAQPISRLLGAELNEFSTERVEIIVPITEQLEQQYGTVHGGVISYAADNALTFAGGSVLPSGRHFRIQNQFS